MNIEKLEFNYKDLFNHLDINGITMFWNPQKDELTFEYKIVDFLEEYEIENKEINQFLNYVYIEDLEKLRNVFQEDLEKAYTSKKHIVINYRIKKNNNILYFIFVGKIIKNYEGYILIGIHYCFENIELNHWNSEIDFVYRELSEEYFINEKIASLIECDRTTELPNCYYFKRTVMDFLKECKEDQIQCAMLMLNLDNFKYVNESFGHEFGDRALKVAANKILSLVSEYDLVCRYSGDTFLIFIPDIIDLNKVSILCRKIVKSFDESIIMDKKEVYVSISIGAALYPYNGIDFETLLKNSDAAMYVAKRNGKNEYNFFNDNISIELNRVYSLQKGLRYALDNKEIFIVFQPKVTLGDFLVRSFEALVRWHSNDIGIVSPDEFIPIAENTKMIIPIGSFVLEEVFKKVRILINEGYSNFKIAINLSEMQLREDSVVSDLKRCINKYRVNPNYIQVEITESMLMKSFDKNIKILNEIKNLGISIALDDFGTGYSSLNYLTKLPIDALKIDRTFVIDLEDNLKNKCIIENIINLSHQLGIEVIAEGVESKQQVEYLKNISCDVVQGYYYSKPEKFEKIKSMICKKISKDN
ncbi:putative bifunctional diguanylate cyclase/phosphodiesterase [Clostridium taeniosporum]|uniref:GGDEF-domain containing protein n=1 Tax=Clostridium taeniosporum TaxID=394958 RepID=A0A1D7XHL7_9CLOT|nr:bifunctional diguanylate cyclase/phosphodiesterase [Clostridium taeniosporum]AOR22851.1 GGDEF-domain containing protein [Clostridium taeniosporum]